MGVAHAHVTLTGRLIHPLLTANRVLGGRHQVATRLAVALECFAHFLSAPYHMHTSLYIHRTQCDIARVLRGVRAGYLNHAKEYGPRLLL